QNEDQVSLARFWAQKSKDPEGFTIKQFDVKGRGVVTDTPRQKGDFLLIYDGEKVTGKEGEEREKKSASCFRYFFKFNSRTYCVDATQETGRLGRLVNHGEVDERNSKMLRISDNKGNHILALICT
ncbi:N-lysine methyltransferase KMT5A-like, partial [Haliotis rubra]|uniref:N-lysine methyltransferase KMT5A-like n=1 Tax=Haliotis rubra TaxID=36100 RepID=UPI001EE5F926